MFFGAWAEGDVTYTEATGAITALGVTTVYEWELKGTNSLEIAVNNSVENGTLFYEQTLSLQLGGIDPDFLAQFHAGNQSRKFVFVQDNNGQTWCLGALYGCDVTAGTLATGAALGDLYGQTWTWVGREKFYAAYIPASTIGNPFGAFSPVIN